MENVTSVSGRKEQSGNNLGPLSQFQRNGVKPVFSRFNTNERFKTEPIDNGPNNRLSTISSYPSHYDYSEKEHNVNLPNTDKDVPKPTSLYSYINQHHDHNSGSLNYANRGKKSNDSCLFKPDFSIFVSGIGDN